jgi:hypothetical protein
LLVQRLDLARVVFAADGLSRLGSMRASGWPRLSVRILRTWYLSRMQPPR